MFGRTNLPKQLQTKTSANTRCQKCLKLGHATYECKNARPYTPRASRSKELAGRGVGSAVRDEPSVVVPDEFKAREGLADRILRAKAEEREREKGKGKGREKSKKGKDKERRYSSDSSLSDSSLSDSESDSDASARMRRRTNHTRSRSRSPVPHKERRYSTTKDRSPAPREDDSPRRKD